MHCLLLQNQEMNWGSWFPKGFALCVPLGMGRNWYKASSLEEQDEKHPPLQSAGQGC